VKPSTIADIQSTIAHSIVKYPSTSLDDRRSGAVQEMGEALQAIEKHRMDPTAKTRNHLRNELFHAIGTAVRLLEEAL